MMTDTRRADAEAEPDTSQPAGADAPLDGGISAAAALIEQLSNEAADLKDRLLRTLAEMENLRRRTEREVAESRAYGVASFARDILAVSDNMARALQTLRAELKERADRGRQGAARRRRADRARARQGAGEARGAQIRAAAAREVRPQPAPGHVRGAGFDAAGRDRRPGGAGRLHDRRAHAASGAGRGRQGRPEAGAGACRQCGCGAAATRAAG